MSLAVAQAFAILCILRHVTIKNKYTQEYNHKEISTLLATLLPTPNASVNLANALPKSTRTTRFLRNWEIPATGGIVNFCIFYLRLLFASHSEKLAISIRAPFFERSVFCSRAFLCAQRFLIASHSEMLAISIRAPFFVRRV